MADQEVKNYAVLVNPFGKIVEVTHEQAENIFRNGIVGENKRPYRYANDAEIEYHEDRKKYNSRFSGLTDEEREARAAGADLTDPYEAHLALQKKKPIQATPAAPAPSGIPQGIEAQPEDGDPAIEEVDASEGVKPLTPNGTVLGKPSGDAAQKLSHSRRRK